ncbi:MAG: hypothetical protein SNG02_03220 [Rikenellaceae bacterium]
MQLPYIYQIVHTCRYKARHLAEHCEVLERCYWQLQSRRITLSRDDLSLRIERLLRESRVLEKLSTHVEIRLWCDGHTTIEIGEKTIYEGYTLRCFNPFAVIQCYDNPMGDYPTSARRAVAELAHHKSRMEGADVSIRCGEDGVVYSCYDSPLFGIKGRTVFLSPSLPSVERSVGVYAINRCGYEFIERPILREHLAKFDELFWVDAFGVTAIAQFEKRRYMSIMAEKIAQQLR